MDHSPVPLDVEPLRIFHPRSAVRTGPVSAGRDKTANEKEDEPAWFHSDFKITQNCVFLQKQRNMIHSDKVKLMDSGTVLFRAVNLEDAISKVRNLLTEGEIEESASGFLAADFSDRLYFSVITVRIEACSDPGIFAASFQEANAGRYLPLPPSRKALERMERIKRLLGE
jgi:nucleoside diphosphate kinase